MIRLLLIFLLLKLTTSCLAQSKLHSPQHDLLKGLDRKRFDALVQKDSLTLAGLLANDLIYTHSSGVVETKREFIHSLLSGRWNYQSIDTDTATVRFYGPVAILTGRARVTLLIDGKSVPIVMIYTDVWHQQRTQSARSSGGNQWQLISWAATRLPN